jgi:hypothetical protein
MVIWNLGLGCFEIWDLKFVFLELEFEFCVFKFGILFLD